MVQIVQIVQIERYNLLNRVLFDWCELGMWILMTYTHPVINLTIF
jgi:hypothetical protein